MSRSTKILIIATCIFTIGCASMPRKPASESSSGARGNAGACGVAGADGISGRINAEALYPLYPLCNVASIITSANDSKKLREFLNAGCRIDVPALPGSANSLWDLAVAKLQIDLIKIMLSEPSVADQVNLYQPVDSRALAKNYLMVPLNPFEVAIYGRTLSKVTPDAAPDAIKDLYVSGHQVAMLQLLLAASSEKRKLEAALQRSIQDLNGRAGPSPCNQAALDAIHGRLKELSK